MQSSDCHMYYAACSPCIDWEVDMLQECAPNDRASEIWNRSSCTSLRPQVQQLPASSPMMLWEAAGPAAIHITFTPCTPNNCALGRLIHRSRVLLLRTSRCGTHCSPRPASAGPRSRCRHAVTTQCTSSAFNLVGDTRLGYFLMRLGSTCKGTYPCKALPKSCGIGRSCH